MNHNTQSGFTLLEVLVALTILAVAAAGLMAITGQSITQSAMLEDKTFALMLAQNRLAQMHAAHSWQDEGVNDEKISMAGREWNVRTYTGPTPRSDMQKTEVSVYLGNPHDTSPLVSLTGYMGRD